MLLESVLWNVYFESRGEPFAGQVAVAEVTLRRAALSGRTICHEVFDDHQFEWTTAVPEPTVRNRTAWETARRAADSALKGDTDEARGATHFHNTKLKRPPRSWKGLCEVRRIAQHVFYRPCEAMS